MDRTPNRAEQPNQHGRFTSTVKVGPKGQIVIPKGARDLFGIQPGDHLMLLADAKQGIAIMPQAAFDQIIAQAAPWGDKPPEQPKEQEE